MGGRRQRIFSADGKAPFWGEGGEKGSPTGSLCPGMQMSLRNPQTTAAWSQPRTHPAAAILLTRCFVHSFTLTKCLMLTAVNFKQPFCVCFSNFVYSDCLFILGWGGTKYLPSLQLGLSCFSQVVVILVARESKWSVLQQPLAWPGSRSTLKQRRLHKITSQGGGAEASFMSAPAYL